MGGCNMNKIKRTEINDEWAHSGIVEAGDCVYISYCMGSEGQSIEKQINGAFDVLAERLGTIGLTLESVVKMDCLFKDIMDLSFLGEIIKERFNGKYPARKAFETKFIREGILFQIDAIAFKG
jgi:enamine deaminase RidA (YjgF/YER057c/UK114 family)